MAIHQTKLAFMLALQDFPSHLSVTEKQNLQEVGKELYYQPRAWQKYIEPRLLQTIKANNKLNKSYQYYQVKLAKLTMFPLEILPTNQQVKNLFSESSAVVKKGFNSDSLPTDYEQQLNNVMILVSSSEQPENQVKKLGFLAKLKQLLIQSSW